VDNENKMKLLTRLAQWTFVNKEYLEDLELCKGQLVHQLEFNNDLIEQLQLLEFKLEMRSNQLKALKAKQ
jgi:hypothetical protein